MTILAQATVQLGHFLIKVPMKLCFLYPKLSIMLKMFVFNFHKREGGGVKFSKAFLLTTVYCKILIGHKYRLYFSSIQKVK